MAEPFFCKEKRAAETRGSDRTRLLETTKRLRPRLLLLDPVVRLHGIDENNAAVQNERLGVALESLIDERDHSHPVPATQR
jgi:hypothetical protein